MTLLTLQKDILVAIGGYTSENFGTYLNAVESVELGGDGTCSRPIAPMNYQYGVDQNVGLVTSDGRILSCGGNPCNLEPCPCVVYNKTTDAWTGGYFHIRRLRLQGDQPNKREGGVACIQC